MARTAAGIYAGAAGIGLIENLLPAGQQLSVGVAFAALALALLAAVAGPRLPRPLLALLGPIGAAMIAMALAETREYGDGAILYVWPALWSAYFLGTRGAIAIVAWIGVVHGLALLSMPASHANIDRWVDVVVVVGVVAVVVRLLVARNERLVRTLEDQARVDPLTGLLNRRGFEERIELERRRAQRDRSSLAVATFDVDHFKAVNDVHGHDAGDRVLAWVARVLTEHVRGIDVVARLGGEEFVVLLPRTEADGALALGERVREALTTTPPLSGRDRAGVVRDLRVTISGGVAAAVAPADVQALLDAADRALYEAKRSGRDRVLPAAALVAA
ncbi:GGDEF domain-containing protein [Conexibacter stalactiti]|uniref:GGDEF domain-containing protein n=1 Tax=Conexibacter stalactiti TaxID=1940611 RepID=A0ABU4HKK9_9ACTN|nr:GGDEF domain-containing protein [Conexibacter stalactiti]MDW5593853.1 GGDEF domain-containing protein [Conexibacter stalactiti]MEC5034495.1 GGDEF domain-containing protein [Conexibacter stalactiti]